MKSLFREMDMFFSRMMPEMTRKFFYVLLVMFGFQMLATSIFPFLLPLVNGLVLQPADVLHFHIWQLLTHGFMHAGFGHLFGNVLALLFFAAPVEYVLGERRFAWFLVLAIVFAGLAHTLAFWGTALATGNGQYLGVGLLGFSSAVFAILVACCVIAPNSIVYVYFLFPMKLKYLVIIYVAIESMYLLDQGVVGGGVSHLGHLTGALVGLVLIKKPALLDYLPGGGKGWLRRRRRPGRVVTSQRISMGHPGRHSNADDRYNDPHWRLDQ